MGVNFVLIDIEHKRIIVNDIYEPAASFIIERFNLPSQMDKLTIEISNYDNDYVIEAIMAYDSENNLRVDLQGVGHGRRIVLSPKEIECSSGAKAGNLPEGEWILVFKLALPIPAREWICEYLIQAKAGA